LHESPELGEALKVTVSEKPLLAVMMIGSVHGVDGVQSIVTGEDGLIVKSGCGIVTVIVVF
jgi:hypothetical protein